MSQRIFKKRAEASETVIKEHFSELKSTTSIEDWAELLATQTKTFGHFEPHLRHNQKEILIKTSKQLKVLLRDKTAAHFLHFEVRQICEKLDELTTVKKLHGEQNTSEYPYKVLLIDFCRQIWKSYKGKDAPLTYQGETHLFTQFITDVLQEVFDYNFTARSAIEAHKKSK